MKKAISIILCLILVIAIIGCSNGAKSSNADRNDPMAIKVLILPKFEVGEMTGDTPGESQYYYDAYVKGGEEYDINGGFEDHKFYVKNGVALYLTGMGKVNAALSLASILQDDRFDFSEAYIFSTGCGGGATGTSVMGDIVLATAVVDFDLGHHADPRDLTDPEQITTWFHDEDYDSSSYKILNGELMDSVYDLIKDTAVETTELTQKIMSEEFDNTEWATRDPKVMRGTVVSSDNYWKGMYDHENTVFMVETYGCPDPYALSEMEDIALANAAARFGMLDRFIVLRDTVNMDVFMSGATPESLWSSGMDETFGTDDNTETADIFATAMKNNFTVGSKIIDSILNDTLKSP